MKRNLILFIRGGNLFFTISIFLCLLITLSSGVNAQTEVKGTVKDSNGNPLAGATIVVKGANKGTASDNNGLFVVKVDDPNSILIISYIGYLQEEVNLANRTQIDVTLVEDIRGLDEVVVIGYGSQKKRDLTGAIASVSNERLANIPATNLTASLQGSVAGINISTPYGAPGGSSSILIRGLNSINASNAPLVVIDGIPGGSIDDINPGDIKSVEVLKDAASTSIYGSRATSGVIIITTKSGTQGKPTLSYEGYMGFSSLSHEVDIMSVDQYVAKRREMYRMTNNLTYDQAQALTFETILGVGNELDMYNSGKSYNWQNELFQTAPMQNHSLSLNGGNEKTQYYLSASITDQTGLVKKSGFQRQSVRANINSNVTKWLSVGTNLFATRSLQKCVQSSIFSAAFQISPLGKMYEDETTQDKYTLYPMNPDTYIANPFTELEIKDYRNKVRLMNSTFVEIKFLKDFSYKVTANTILDFINNKYFTPTYTKQVEAFDKYESASITRNNNSYLNIENMLTYNKTIGDHKIGATFVFSTEEYNGEGLYAYGKDFSSDYYTWTALQLGNKDYQSMSSSEEKTFLESLIGRLNYSFKGKYLAQFTIRRDRSSKFAEGNRDAVFPGGSVGWRISDEPFLKDLGFIDNLKFRLSYAFTGNQGIGYKSIYNTGSLVYYTTGQDANGTIVSGLEQSTLANKDLRWEKSAQFNVGLDFSVFKGKFEGVVEYYHTKTSDLLLSRDISSITGFTSMLTNIGSVENQGIEIALNSNVINNKKFKWDINVSFTSNKNKITELYGDGKDDVSNGWFIGQPIGVVYDYVFDGILQKDEVAPAYMDNTVGTVGDNKNILPGEAKVKDIGGWETLDDGSTVRTKVPDGKIDEADKTIIGQTQPKWFGSFGMQFKYQNLFASFLINHVHGTMRRIPIKISDRTQSLDIPYYTDENPSTQYGRPAWSSTIDGISRTGNQYGYLSYNQSGSYTRLQDVTIGYSLPKKLIGKLGMNSFQVYVTGQNLITITDFKGYDPSLEYTSNQTSANVDRLYGYPTTRNWIFGVKVNF
jgi:TonB-linked SusC/RagA family outer membrane protein